MKHGLSSGTVARIQQVLSRFPDVDKAVLYGSRAKGTFRIGSDIDLTLFGNNLDRLRLALLGDALDDLLLPYRIDLSMFSRLSDAELIEHIRRVGVVIYDREHMDVMP